MGQSALRDLTRGVGSHRESLTVNLSSDTEGESHGGNLTRGGGTDTRGTFRNTSLGEVGQRNWCRREG